MADLICRWRNGTPKTVVELVNSLPHKKMKNEEFRKSMSTKWQGEFFTAPYQLACQLALYCEADDGYYYPRFDHDITEEEAQEYLELWLPRYYVPNPYVGKDGFDRIPCPTYVIKNLYDYSKSHPNATYAEAYKEVFKENIKNNDDIVKNYINRFAKVLTMDKDGKLNITDYNPQKIFSFMDRNNKKAFFDNFSIKEESPTQYYQNSSLETKKDMFSIYLKSLGKSESTIKQYVSYHLCCDDVLEVIKKDTNKENLYDVINTFEIKRIWNDVNDLPANKSRNNVYTAAISNYKNFIDFLDTEEAQKLYGEWTVDNESKSENKGDADDTPETESQHPFSISRMISLISETGLLYSPDLIKRFAFSLMSKRFLILSGLAGSGKTQLALAFANALIEDDSQLCVVPVGADWTNREPLLGFPNALQEGLYVKPESGVLDLLIEANKQENKTKPYFLVLDEMNMSYVERYFADFLSAMESHKAIPLWKGISEEVPQTICLSSNLFIIGTTNVDETTYMFSPKVLDRANVIEFKISLEEMEQFLIDMKPINRESINYKAADMGASFVNIAKSNELADDKEIKDTLTSFFKDLKSVNSEFGYRSATEIYRFVSHALKNDDTETKMTLAEIVDCAIVQKLLPKLHGSRKKLDKTLNTLWRECFEGEAQKETTGISIDQVDKAKYKLTADKIQRMYEAAMANGFTSFSEA